MCSRVRSVRECAQGFSSSRSEKVCLRREFDRGAIGAGFGVRKSVCGGSSTG